MVLACVIPRTLKNSKFCVCHVMTLVKLKKRDVSLKKTIANNPDSDNDKKMTYDSYYNCMLTCLWRRQLEFCHLLLSLLHPTSNKQHR